MQNTVKEFFLILFVSVAGCRHAEQVLPLNAEPQRIIATLPSISEVLFDIGLGEKIVGVSAFAKYPPQVKNIDKIGGLYDTNVEKMLSLQPDLLIVSAENTQLRSMSGQLHCPVLVVDHRTLQGVLDSYTTIAEPFGKHIQELAAEKQRQLRDKLRRNDSQKNRLKVLICIDRSRGTGKIQNLFIAGKGSFLSDAVQIAGGENIGESVGLLAPTLSAEGIIGLKPDVIIDMCTQESRPPDLTDWRSLGEQVPAVQNCRIYAVTEDYATIPGPRTLLLVEKLRQILSTPKSE